MLCLRCNSPPHEFIVLFFLFPHIPISFRCQNSRLKIAHCGLRVFQSVFKGSGDYRVCQEGLHAVLPFITKQIVYANEADFVTLLESPQTHTRAFTDPEFIKQINAQSTIDSEISSLNVAFSCSNLF
jgi:hypothetical protein